MSSQKDRKFITLLSSLRLKRTWPVLLLLGFGLLLISCSSTRIILQTAPSKPKGAAAHPPLESQSLLIWETQTAPSLKQTFQSKIYGNNPENLTLLRTQITDTTTAQFNGKGNISVETLRLKNAANNEISDFDLVIVSPKAPRSVKAIIIMQSFCPVEDVVPQATFPNPRQNGFSCNGQGILNSIFGYFFGRYIVSPPIETLLEHGYAFAVMYPSAFIPDHDIRGLKALDQFFSDQRTETRTRSIMAWAKQFSLVSDYLKSEKKFPKTITYGHSRYGKTALVAAAFNPSIDAVIAHQSGTGGASLNRDKKGETVSAITRQYPHWFLDHYTENIMSIDQHHLLALIAPRPILLGNAKRDVWSDPEGAFRAAQGANLAYNFYNEAGLSAQKLTQFKPSDKLSFWMRVGTHGVVKEDWPAFLDFLDAHFVK